MDSFSFDENTDAKDWLKKIDQNNPEHILYIKKFIEQIFQWGRQWGLDFYYKDFILLLESLIEFGEPAAKYFAKYLYSTEVYGTKKYYDQFLETNNYSFYFYLMLESTKFFYLHDDTSWIFDSAIKKVKQF